MSRTSYPIVRRLLIVLVALGFSASPAVAQQVITRNIPTASLQSEWFLLLLIIVMIGFSIVYRKFMYNRLLASKRNLETLPLKGNDKLQNESIDGLLHQVVRGEGKDNGKTHTQVVNNLLSTIGLLQQQVSFLQGDVVTNSLRETSHRLFTLSLLHAKLYINGEGEMVDINELVPVLIGHFAESSGNNSMVRFIYSSASGNIELPIQQAVPVTFFINEVLHCYGSLRAENDFSESVGIYLQESKGLVKLTVRTEGLDAPATFTSLKHNLHQQVQKYFPDTLHARLSIDQSFGSGINLQFRKQPSKQPVAY
ncbi:MAG TPA: histidine kinase dimerization/phosphoacceptor domain -containing protein [Flavitalea sp.]|nr:histidine kinase dimerization/phosphoacceptor domain -containing protein [Flavitalea sp.]